MAEPQRQGGSERCGGSGRLINTEQMYEVGCLGCPDCRPVSPQVGDEGERALRVIRDFAAGREQAASEGRALFVQGAFAAIRKYAEEALAALASQAETASEGRAPVDRWTSEDIEAGVEYVRYADHHRLSETASRQVKELQAEVERLRGALRAIAEYEAEHPRQTAKSALSTGDTDGEESCG